MKLQREQEKGSREAKRRKEGGVITSFSVGQMCVFSTFCDIKSLLIIFLFPGVDCRPTLLAYTSGPALTAEIW